MSKRAEIVTKAERMQAEAMHDHGTDRILRRIGLGNGARLRVVAVVRLGKQCDGPSVNDPRRRNCASRVN